jgi:hypothetical protein
MTQINNALGVSFGLGEWIFLKNKIRINV